MRKVEGLVLLCGVGVRVSLGALKFTIYLLVKGFKPSPILDNARYAA